MPTQIFVSIPPALEKFLANCGAPEAKKLLERGQAELDELYRLAEEHQKISQEMVKMHELLAGAEVVERCEVPVLDAARGPERQSERI